MNGYFGTREANAAADQTTFNAVAGMEQLRTLIRVKYDVELTLGSVNRFVNDLIRASKGTLTITQAEQTEITQALTLSGGHTASGQTKAKRSAAAGAAKRKRGRPPATTTSPQGVQADIRLYRDWKASGLTAKVFLRNRGIEEDEGLKQLDRGNYHANKPGRNSGE